MSGNQLVTPWHQKIHLQATHLHPAKLKSKHPLKLPYSFHDFQVKTPSLTLKGPIVMLFVICVFADITTLLIRSGVSRFVALPPALPNFIRSSIYHET